MKLKQKNFNSNIILYLTIFWNAETALINNIKKAKTLDAIFI